MFAVIYDSAVRKKLHIRSFPEVVAIISRTLEGIEHTVRKHGSRIRELPRKANSKLAVAASAFQYQQQFIPSAISQISLFKVLLRHVSSRIACEFFANSAWIGFVSVGVEVRKSFDMDFDED